MTRSLRIGLCAALLAMASGACAPRWPGVTASADPEFAAGRLGVRTIDVLPADVQIWTHPEEQRPPAAIAERFDAEIAGSLPALLAGRGYQVVASLDWQGRYVSPRGQPRRALSAQQVAETAFVLSGYGVAVQRSGDRGLIPHLPHRLGAETGADATLYVGGWAFAGKDPSGTGTKILKGVGIVLVAGIIVVAVIAALDGKGGGGLGKLGGAARGVAKAGGAAARVAGRAVGGLGRVALRVGEGTARAMAEVAQSIHHIEIHAGDPDCFGRRGTHVNWYSGRPDYYREPEAKKTGRSAAMIEMTLIDNRRGEVLWHARQRFPANPANPGQVRKVLKTMLEAIPER